LQETGIQSARLKRNCQANPNVGRPPTNRCRPSARSRAPRSQTNAQRLVSLRSSLRLPEPRMRGLESQGSSCASQYRKHAGPDTPNPQWWFFVLPNPRVRQLNRPSDSALPQWQQRRLLILCSAQHPVPPRMSGLRWPSNRRQLHHFPAPLVSPWRQTTCSVLKCHGQQVGATGIPSSPPACNLMWFDPITSAESVADRGLRSGPTYWQPDPQQSSTLLPIPCVRGLTDPKVSLLASQ
jgi:hypothetical protein